MIHRTQPSSGPGSRPWRRAACIAVALCTLAPAAQADTALRKAGRGLAGITTSFLEVPGNMAAETNKSGLGRGMTLGFVLGLGGIVVRTLVGVYEFVTCPIPLPANFEPVVTPEFPWNYFDEGNTDTIFTLRRAVSDEQLALR